MAPTPKTSTARILWHRLTRYYGVQVVALAALYIVTGKLGLLLSVPPGFATVIWPPSGLALGVCLIYGRRLWPGIWLGSFLLNAYIAGAFSPEAGGLAVKLAVAGAIAAGSTLQILLACLLADRAVGTPLKLVSVSQILKLFLLAGPVACVMAASVGVASLHVAGLVSDTELVNNWVSWWGGDVFGVIVFLPLALVAPGNPYPVELNGREIGRISALTLFLLLIPLGLTFYTWKIVSVNEFNAKQDAFESLAQESEKALRHRVESYDNALIAAAAFWEGAHGASQDGWATYVSALDIKTSYPGLNGLGIIEASDTPGLAALNDRMRAQGQTAFAVHPQVPGDTHFIIATVAPLQGNREAQGLDLAFEANRRAALENARDLGLTAVTRKILLVQDKERTPGFLLVHPVYAGDTVPDTVAGRRSGIAAWIYAPFIAKNMLTDLTESQGKQLDIQIYDQDTAAPADLVYDSGDASTRGSLSVERHIHIGQATWLVVWKSTRAFDAAGRSLTPVLILSAGLLFTAMLAVLFFGMSLRDPDAIDSLGTREKLLIPATVFLLLALGSGFLYRTLSIQEDRYLTGLMDRDAAKIQELERSQAADKLKALQRSAGLWGAAQSVPGAPWRQDAQEFVTDTMGLQNIRWFDRAHRLEWSITDPTEPLVEPALPMPDAPLFDEAQFRDAPVLTGLETGPHTGPGFDVVVPVESNAAAGDFLIGHFDAAAFGAAGLTEDIRKAYQVGLSSAGGSLVLNNTAAALADTEVTRPLRIANQVWTLHVRPTKAFWTSQRSPIPIIALVAGLVISLLSALTVQALLVLSRKSRELLRSEETFRLAMESAPIGEALVGLDGRWLKVNGVLCDLLGYSREDLLTTDFQAITHADDLDTDMSLVARVLAGEIPSYVMEKRYLHKDGHIIWGLLSVSLVRNPDGSPSYFISQIQDITERREMERMKSDFISTVSHELRTPLTSIRGSLDFVASSEAEGMSEAAQKLLRMARRNCDRLVGLVNDILDIDKIASGSMRFDITRQDAGELLENCVALNHAFAAEWKIALEAAPLAATAAIAVDAERFQQAMANLISNAVKFSPSGGRVSVSAVVSNEVQFSVADQGPGIPAAFRPRIFGRFSQADSSSTRAKGGSGLGLHITKELVEQMGGTIGYESVEGQGSTFWIAFPVVGAS